MSDNREYKVCDNFASYERIRAIKEDMAAFLGSYYDSIKLVGVSLIFVDTKSEARMEHKETIAWFDMNRIMRMINNEAL